MLPTTASRMNLTWRFALVALVIFILLGVGLSWVLGRTIVAGALEEEQAEARDAVANRLLQHVTPQDLTVPYEGERLEAMNAWVKERIVSDRTARVKIWNNERRVIFANNPAQIGQIFPGNFDLEESLAGRTSSALSQVKKAENTTEVGYSALLEVYTPIIFPGSTEVAGAFEIYRIYDPVARQIAEMQTNVTLALSGGLAAIYCALLGIVHGGTRTIRRQHRGLMSAYNEIYTLNKDLEQRVIDRTAELAASKERFQALYNDNPAMYCTVAAADGTILSVNQFGARQLGYAVEELVGRPFAALHAPEDGQAAAQHLADCLRNPGQVAQWELRKFRKDGVPWWVQETARAVRDVDGTSVVLIVSADITERRQAEEARARLAAILEVTTDCVITTDVDTKVLSINSAGRMMLGISPDTDLDQLRLVDLLPEEKQSMMMDSVIAVTMANGAWSDELTLLHRDGREIPVSLVSLSHQSPDGAVTFLSFSARDISERKRFEQQLAHLASHDPLTELYNRRRFEEEMEIQLVQGRRYGMHGVLMFLDLDHFKTVNDTLGHQAGDQLLVTAATTLQQRLRSCDLLARLGGDEFAVYLPQTGQEQALLVAQRILDAFGQISIDLNGHPMTVTSSIGIALFPEHAMTKKDLLARADLAMYQSKANGRARYTLYSPEMDDNLVSAN